MPSVPRSQQLLENSKCWIDEYNPIDRNPIESSIYILVNTVIFKSKRLCTATRER